MDEIILNYINKDSNNTQYSSDEIQKAINMIKNFINGLDKCKIVEGGVQRKLSQLEEMILIYDFVANRNYVVQPDSHSIVGVLNSGNSVCEGFTKLSELLCKLRGIPFLYKNVNTQNGGESHGNFQVIVHDKDGIAHCLHCDPTIDCLEDGKENLTYNAFLIETSHIKDFYRQQSPVPGITEVFWNISVKQLTAEQIKASFESVSSSDEFLAMMRGENVQDIVTSRYNDLRSNIAELGSFLGVEVPNLDTNEQVLEMYQRLLERYNEISVPLDRETLSDTIRNIYRQNFPEIIMPGIEQRINATYENEKRFWNGQVEEKNENQDIGHRK